MDTLVAERSKLNALLERHGGLEGLERVTRAALNLKDEDTVETVERLVRRDPRDSGQTIIPDLAHSWDISKDGKTYTFKLRDDAYFHNGRKMTADEEKLFGIEKLNVPRSDIPAVTHIDYSGRIQTVHKETNPAFHDLISSYKGKTGCSVVVNTSFNVRGEPIVCTPEDAWRCFMGSEIEVLVVGNCFLRKEDQDPALKLDYKNAFELD